MKDTVIGPLVSSEVLPGESLERLSVAVSYVHLEIVRKMLLTSCSFSDCISTGRAEDLGHFCGSNLTRSQQGSPRKEEWVGSGICHLEF